MLKNNLKDASLVWALFHSPSPFQMIPTHKYLGQSSHLYTVTPFGVISGNDFHWDGEWVGKRFLRSRVSENVIRFKMGIYCDIICVLQHSSIIIIDKLFLHTFYYHILSCHTKGFYDPCQLRRLQTCFVFF